MTNLPELVPVIATSISYASETDGTVTITHCSHAVDNIAGNFIVSPELKDAVTSPTGFVEYVVLRDGNVKNNDIFSVILPSGENPASFIDLHKHGIVHIRCAEPPEGADSTSCLS